MVGAFPEWRAVGRAGRDHLMLDQTVAWCGMSLGDSVPGGARERCKLCLGALRRYQDMAVATPPERVTESVLLTVSRPAGGEDVAAVLARKLAAHTSWVWTLHPADASDSPVSDSSVSDSSVSDSSVSDSTSGSDSTAATDSSTATDSSADALVQRIHTTRALVAAADLHERRRNLRRYLDALVAAAVLVLSDAQLSDLGLTRARP